MELSALFFLAVKYNILYTTTNKPSTDMYHPERDLDSQTWSALPYARENTVAKPRSAHEITF